ncbi:MAG: glycosyltransferase, partial [Bacteroidota bacterium]
MRILQLALRIPYPLRDGGAIAIYNNTKYLSAAGHEVTLLALNTTKHHQDPSVMAEHARVITTDIDTTPRAVPALKNLLFGRLPYNVERFDVPEHHERLAKLLQAEQFDVILFERVYLGVYLETIRKYSDAPVILRAHNVEYEIWQRLASNESNLAKRLLYKQLALRGEAFERSVLPRFDG